MPRTRNRALDEGEFDGEKVACARHLWEFDAAGGARVNPTDCQLEDRPLPRVSDDDVIEVDLTSSAPGTRPRQQKGDKMYTVIARYQLSPAASVTSSQGTAQSHNLPTRGEPGCVGFIVGPGRSTIRTVVLYEQYQDEHAFQAHLDSAQLPAVRQSSRSRAAAERNEQVSFYATVEP